MSLTGGFARHSLLRQQKQNGIRLAGMEKNHSSEAFFMCDGPLKLMIFSAHLEIRKQLDGG
jgi:hypothetical protein